MWISGLLVIGGVVSVLGLSVYAGLVVAFMVTGARDARG